MYYGYHQNFNPRTPCGVRRAALLGAAGGGQISIHAPRAGCDLIARGSLRQVAEISIHAPRAGCDEFGVVPVAEELKFQSTHPVRGATLKNTPAFRSLCISIHAPRAGCDVCQTLGNSECRQFQSTHPVRGATAAGLV